MLKNIIDNKSEVDNYQYDFTELGAYVKSTSDIHLHNYAVGLSHGLDMTLTVNLNTIRIWCILDNLLDHWTFNQLEHWEILSSWTNTLV